VCGASENDLSSETCMAKVLNESWLWYLMVACSLVEYDSFTGFA
jgi:hypothetical protein